ncbi:hypothetical protein BV326_04123 [Pseudomonas syringae pv. actinidiae]|nr:hypothetical protein BV326_04123 [Pseudomonas syringae pv. actinidiae]
MLAPEVGDGRPGFCHWQFNLCEVVKLPLPEFSAADTRFAGNPSFFGRDEGTEIDIAGGRLRLQSKCGGIKTFQVFVQDAQ